MTIQRFVGDILYLQKIEEMPDAFDQLIRGNGTIYFSSILTPVIVPNTPSLFLIGR